MDRFNNVFAVTFSDEPKKRLD